MLATLAEPLLDLVLPRRCGGCGAQGAALCASCRQVTGPLVARVPTPPGTALEVVAATDYDGPVRRALLAYKERGRRDLTGPLATMLSQAVRGLLDVLGLRPGSALLVCVPSSRRAAARRGGDHMLRLAGRVASGTGVPLARGLLMLPGPVLDSAGLSAVDRERNLHAAMRAAARPTRMTRRVIVLDDVVSSGSTMREATRALSRAGWDVTGGAAVAATPPEGSGASVTWSAVRPGDSSPVHWQHSGNGSNVVST